MKRPGGKSTPSSIPAEVQANCHGRLGYSATRRQQAGIMHFFRGLRPSIIHPSTYQLPQHHQSELNQYFDITKGPSRSTNQNIPFQAPTPFISSCCRCRCRHSYYDDYYYLVALLGLLVVRLSMMYWIDDHDQWMG